MNKKRNFTTITMLICLLAAGQTNKPVIGDFGVKYGVSFNGTAIQGLTFSGLVTNHWEVGSSVNVQYSQSTAASISAQQTYYDHPSGQSGFYVIGQQTTTSSNKTMALSINPFILYHFEIKSNLDLYTGANLSLGTGSITLSNSSNSVTVATDYYSQIINSTTYPFGYSVGGGLMLGGQYFFYKNLALGISANLGITYIGRKGTEVVSYTNINSGSQNNNVPINSGTYYGEINSHTLSLASSSVGLSLVFYISPKKKVKEETQGL